MPDAPASQARAPSGVWIIIPVHNRCQITRRCLSHLRELGIPAWAKVLVVDDGSTDGTEAMVRSEHPWAELLKGDGNLWWAGAIRLGMVHAIGHGAQTVCWLNDDTLPDPGSLELLVSQATASRGICGGICPTGGPDGFSYGGGRLEKGWPISLKPAPQPGSGLHEVQWLHGNMVAIPAAVWDAVGLPECRWMKHHFADVEYTSRAGRNGIPVRLHADATARADWNDSGSYLSWRDEKLSAGKLILGFWNPKMWWYIPGVAYFQIFTFGLPGLLRFIFLFPKAVGAVLLKACTLRGKGKNLNAISIFLV